MYFNFLHNKDTTFTPFAAHKLLPTASQLISYTFLHEGNESLLGKEQNTTFFGTRRSTFLFDSGSCNRKKMGCTTSTALVSLSGFID